jgi:Protein of unknown function (DUF1616)
MGPDFVNGLISILNYLDQHSFDWVLALRVAVGLVLVLVLPGAALTAALFPPRSLGWARRILFSLGLSLAVIALGGLLLNLTPFGLQGLTWLAFIGGVTLGAAASVLWKGRGHLSHLTFQPTVLMGRVSAREAALFGVASLVILLAVGVARMPAPEQGLQGYSTLYLVPANDGQPNDVALGVRSDEFAPTLYNLQLKLNGRVVQTWDGLALQPGESWDTVLKLPSGQAGTGRVEASLYRLDAPNVAYRSVALVRNPAGE